MVELLNRQRKRPFSVKWVRDYIEKAAEVAGVADKNVTVVFLSEEKMKELNREWRGIDAPTDCLSFPVGDDDPFMEDYLGDIAICVPVAYKQAAQYFPDMDQRDALIREVTVLFVHSLLHLLGYDHENEEDAKEMAEKEASILNQIFEGEGIVGLNLREV